ncbi:MAG: hypothetical protein JJW00_04120 [Sulfurimonas sp.]|nr:hypothetical protein [Sulfurimonas sp.]
MTNLNSSEKIALEEIFLVLDNRKNRKIESIKKYIMFYKRMKMFSSPMSKLPLEAMQLVFKAP